MTVPVASVVIASYNHDRFLRENLDSLLAQTHRDLEIVVVDDGSTDGSFTTLSAYAQANHRVRLFTHEGRRNRGMYATLNRGVSEARGRFIAIQGSDDVWLPDKLEAQLQVLAGDEATGAVYCQAHLIDESGAYLETGGQRTVFGRRSDDLLLSLLAYNIVPAMSVVYRAGVIPGPPFAEDLLFADWDLNVRLALRTRVVCVERPLVLYRRHPAAATSVSAMVRDGLAHRLALLDRVFEYPELSGRPDVVRLRRLARKSAAEHALFLAGAAAEAGDVAHTSRNVSGALRLDPWVALSRPRELAGILARLGGRLARRAA
jgi:glycosyltransferase involved in cell wall biosynthesis